MPIESRLSHDFGAEQQLSGWAVGSSPRWKQSGRPNWRIKLGNEKRRQQSARLRMDANVSNKQITCRRQQQERERMELEAKKKRQEEILHEAREAAEARAVKVESTAQEQAAKLQSAAKEKAQLILKQVLEPSTPKWCNKARMSAESSLPPAG